MEMLVEVEVDQVARVRLVQEHLTKAMLVEAQRLVVTIDQMVAVALVR
jgi:hypothetical protein